MMKRKRRSCAYIIAAFIVILAYIITVILLGCFIALITELLGSGYERDDFVKVVCIAAPGDTAWDYARRYCPDGLDYREYLEWCARENGMDGIMGDIQSGRSYVFFKLK